MDKSILEPSQNMPSGGNSIKSYGSLILVCTIAVGFIAYFPFQVSNKSISLITTVFAMVFCLTFTYLVTRMTVQKEYHDKIWDIKQKYERKIGRLKKEYDMITLEKTIRDGTQTLIKNAVDYFKIENIKNEMGHSAAIQNLQLDKYGQIIELLADFSLILPDYQENKLIVENEISHQIQIYEIDEKLFATFLHRILEKYLITVNKKIKEKSALNRLDGMKECPQCAELILLKSPFCKHCGYELEQESIGGLKSKPILPKLELIENITRTKDYIQMGKKYYRDGKYNDAIESLSCAIKQDPTHATAFYNRAIVYNKIGNQIFAEKDLKSASDLGHSKAKELLKLKDQS